MLRFATTPDQLRTTPRERRTAQHPENVETFAAIDQVGRLHDFIEAAITFAVVHRQH